MFYIVVLGILVEATILLPPVYADHTSTNTHIKPPKNDRQGHIRSSGGHMSGYTIGFYKYGSFDNDANCVCSDGVLYNWVPCYVNLYNGYLGDFSFSLTIPHGVTLNKNSFRGTNCRKGLEKAIINGDSIGAGTFSLLHKLKNVTALHCEVIKENAFNSCVSLRTIIMPVLKTIEPGAFAFTALDTIDLPELTTMGNSIFFACVSLQSVNMPKVEFIPEHTFFHCEALNTVTILEATQIKSNAFFGNTALTSIDMPKVTAIGNSAFRRCETLRTIDLSNNQADNIGFNAFTEASCEEAGYAAETNICDCNTCPTPPPNLPPTTAPPSTAPPSTAPPSSFVPPTASPTIISPETSTLSSGAIAGFSVAGIVVGSVTAIVYIRGLAYMKTATTLIYAGVSGKI